MVISDLTVSLDGFVAGADARPDNPMGGIAPRLHGWAFAAASYRERQGQSGGVQDVDDEVGRESFDRTGAHIIGRRMFDEGEVVWPNPSPFRRPVFVLTNRPRAPWVQDEMTFTFVTDGIESALRQAREAAGDMDVMVSGGAATVQQFLNAELVEELQIHIAPLLIKDGIRLFDNVNPDVRFKPDRVLHSPRATHIRYAVTYGEA